MGEAIEVAQPTVEEGSDEEPLSCRCDHFFTRGQLDVIKRVYIDEVIDERVEDFKLKNYVTKRHECPQCSDCAFEDDRIFPVEPQRQWMCKECMTIHDDEDEAVDCCD